MSEVDWLCKNSWWWDSNLRSYKSQMQQLNREKQKLLSCLNDNSKNVEQCLHEEVNNVQQAESDSKQIVKPK